MNKVEIQGGLTRDPELRFLPSGMPVCEFSMALNGTRYDKDARAQVVTTTFVTCQAWGDAAEEFAGEFGQGDEVYVMGRLDQRTIEKRDGTKESKTRIEVLFWHAVRKRRRAGAAVTAPGAPGRDPWA